MSNDLKSRIAALEAELAQRAAELIDPMLRRDPHVADLLDYTKAGGPVPSELNIRRVLNNDPRMQGRFRYNRFSGLILKDDNPIEEVDTIEIKIWLEEVYSLRVSKDRVFDTIRFLAEKKHSFDPLFDYLTQQGQN